MPLVEWIGAWPGAVFLRDSGTAYLLVNAAHILGVGLLVGAIIPLDLRLLGLFRHAPLAVLAPFLSRAAATGAVLAIVTGLWLFSVKPGEYLGNAAFLWKAGAARSWRSPTWRSSTPIAALRPRSPAARCGRRCAWSLCARSCCGYRCWWPAAGSDFM